MNKPVVSEALVFPNNTMQEKYLIILSIILLINQQSRSFLIDVNEPYPIVSRSEWNAVEPKNDTIVLELPIKRVIIAHTATDICLDKKSCIKLIQSIQRYHMDQKEWKDIAYNFLIGGDGRIYVGRGWLKQGSHTKDYNENSIGIGFIGTFESDLPTDRQLEAGKYLIRDGVLSKTISDDYALYGHRQLRNTVSPGQKLYNIIQTWNHFNATTT